MIICLFRAKCGISFLNPFAPDAPFLYPLETSENLRVFWSFQGAEKGCFRNEWVNKPLTNLLMVFTRKREWLTFKSSCVCLLLDTIVVFINRKQGKMNHLNLLVLVSVYFSTTSFGSFLHAHHSFNIVNRNYIKKLQVLKYEAAVKWWSKK